MMRLTVLEGEVREATDYTLEHQLPSGRWTFGRALGENDGHAHDVLGSARAINPEIAYRVVMTRREVLPW